MHFSNLNIYEKYIDDLYWASRKDTVHYFLKCKIFWHENIYYLYLYMYINVE